MPRQKRDRKPARFLGAPDVQVAVPGVFPTYCYSVILVALAGVGTLGCFFTAFQAPLWRSPVLWTGAACVLLCCAQSLTSARLESKWKILFPLSLALIWGVLLYHFFPQAVQGLFQTINLMLEAYGGRLRMTLPRLSVAVKTQQNPAAAVTVFACLFEFPFFWVLSTLFVRFHSTIGIFAWTGIFLLAPLALSIVPASWALAAIILFWAFLLLSIPAMGHGRTSTSRSGKKIKVSGATYARPITLLILPLFALCMAVLYRAFPPAELTRPAFVDELRAQITGSVNLPAIFKGGTGSGNNRVDLTKLGDRNFSGATALRVRHRWDGGGKTEPDMKKNYLKSFVGSEYTGESWEQLSPDQWKEADALLNGKHAQALAAELRLSMPLSEQMAASYRLDVEKLNVDSRSIYSPYGLREPEPLPSGIGYAGDGFLRSSRWLFGPKEYSLQAANVTEYPAPLGYRFGIALYGAAPSFTRTVDDDSGFFTFQRTGSGDDLALLERYAEAFAEAAAGGSTAADRFAIPQEAREFYDGEGMDAANAAERYTNFVYEHYLQLPQATRDFALRFLEENSFADSYGIPDPETVGREAVAEQVRSLLSEVCQYSLSAQKPPEGRDFTEYFLTESKKGYCVHFATAGVVLLRALGVPARYAEGYVSPVPEGNAWVRVPDQNAHAWVEIYCSGSGWLPVEMTPQNPNAPATYENATVPQEEVEQNATPVPSHDPVHHLEQSSPAPMPTASPAPGPTAAAGVRPGAQTQGKNETQPNLFFLIPAALLLPFVLLWILRKLRIYLRRRSFRQRNRNKAALCVYRHLLRLYRESYLLPFGKAEPPEEVTQLALKARFSSHVITKKELQDLLDRVDALERALDRGLSRPIRLRRKYLSALF